MKPGFYSVRGANLNDCWIHGRNGVLGGILMTQIALTRASQLIQITDTLEGLGESPERVLEQAKLPMWHYCDPDDLIPRYHIHALMQQAALSLGSPTFGLQVGSHTSVSGLGTFGRLVAKAITIHDAFQTYCRLLHLHTSGCQNWMTEAGDEVWLCRSPYSGSKVGRLHMEQYGLMRLIEYGRLAAGPCWQPAKVCLQTQEAPPRELSEALGEPEINIGQRFTGVAIPRAFLALPPRWSGTTPRAGTDQNEERLRDTAPATNFPDALRQVARTLMKEGTLPRVEAMAEITGLSVRSLQRRLAKHGVTHNQIVDQARYRTATRLLEDSEIRITDIGMELGYADSAHFSRAFKRWSGVTPREYRSHQLVQ